MGIYELDIRKEVLNALVDSIYATCVNISVRLQDPSLSGMILEILAIRREIRDTETMEELEIVNEKLLEYHKKLCKIESG
jgi:hypothetical protein